SSRTPIYSECEGAPKEKGGLSFLKHRPFSARTTPSLYQRFTPSTDESSGVRGTTRLSVKQPNRGRSRSRFQAWVSDCSALRCGCRHRRRWEGIRVEADEEGASGR